MRNLEPQPPLDSVDRALKLIVALRDGEVMSVKAAAERLNVVPSTAHRLLAALCHGGFAMQNRERLYRAGPELASWSDSTRSISTVRQIVRPTLESLVKQLDETVQVWVLEGPQVRYVDGVESDQTLRIRVGVWDQVPAYCSAGGKAMLASLSNAQIDHLHGGGLPPWRSTRISSVLALKRHLATVRQQGYATNIEEAAQGVNGIGVAVLDQQGRPVVAISAAIPSIRFSKEKVEECAQALLAAAAAVEKRMTSVALADLQDR
ncbi:IclR family transcriptional regulator [Cryobacterium sp. PH29-G1]|uniref:IclR family transcriptional regulator n=1 Tax=Cryobacterium sp. PH29-G1 TaxID=3046211 RepID=UPI0024BB269D|nr:IclR family transcriptional regulator [Cryobacterium sp. PH29-G1]MDJ0349586.1 IclR family transcriptional regulator [Cryobacterium sp. PH29-G1]